MIRLSILVGAGQLEIDKRPIRNAMRVIGNEIAAVTRALIRGSAGGGRTYWLHGSSGGRGKYKASAAGQPPVSVSGNLARSIVVRPFKSGEGVAVRENAFYALFLARGAHGGGGNTRNRANILRAGEIGPRGRVLRGQNRMKASAISQTRVLLPRPSLERALDERAATIEPRLKDALLQGIRFRRIKA